MSTNRDTMLKPVPSEPKLILRTFFKEKHRHNLYDQLNGQEATLVAISEDSVPFDFYCEVRLPDGRFAGIGTEFLELVDTSRVPQGRTGKAAQAWLFCHYRDEAFERGVFTKCFAVIPKGERKPVLVVGGEGEAWFEAYENGGIDRRNDLAVKRFRQTHEAVPVSYAHCQEIGRFFDPNEREIPVAAS